MAPVAPAWFSTTNDWPRLADILLAIVRAMVSVEPPGGNGTTTVTGFSGKAANVGATPATVATAPTARARRMVFIVSPGRLRGGGRRSCQRRERRITRRLGAPVVLVQYIFPARLI